MVKERKIRHPENVERRGEKKRGVEKGTQPKVGQGPQKKVQRPELGREAISVFQLALAPDGGEKGGANLANDLEAKLTSGGEEIYLFGPMEHGWSGGWGRVKKKAVPTIPEETVE